MWAKSSRLRRTGELLVHMLGRSGAVARLWLECQGGWVD